MRIEKFFDFARERHLIHLRRIDQPTPDEIPQGPPWTTDPILQDYRFTNVYRELDATTAWFRNNVREPLRNDPRVLLATIAFRWFNKIETGCVLKWGEGGGKNADLFLSWNSESARNRLRRSGPPWTNGAYIIKTPTGMDKLDGVLWCIDECAKNIEQLYALMNKTSLEAAWSALKEMPYMGPFMAYEVVTDLCHTHMLKAAPDILTWANPGPGCRRGLGRLMNSCPNTFRSNQSPLMMQHMQNILSMSEQMFTQHFSDAPAWEMREVEHTLCEFDKYERVRLGEGRPKQRFKA